VAAPEQPGQGSRWWVHILLGVAACFWFLYVFRYYAPQLTLDALGEIGALLVELASRWGIIDGLLILWFCVAAYLIGDKIIRLLNASLDTGLQALLATVVGIMAISWTMILLAALRLLYPPVAYLLLAAPLVICRRELRRMAASLRRPRGRASDDSPRTLAGRIAAKFLVVYVCAVLLVSFLAALAPETEFDPLIIHLNAAQHYAQEHRLRSLPEIPQTFFPRNITMLFSLGYLLRGESAVKLMNYLFGLLTVLATFTFARRMFSRHTGLVSGAILLSSPLFVWEMKTAHLELGFALFTCLSLFATVEWLRNRDTGWFRIAVLFTAFSLGTRYQALFSLGSLSLIILFVRAFERRKPSAALRESVLFFSLSILGMIPWGVANLVQTGNPIFPFFNDIFQSPYWSPQQTVTALEQQRAAVPVTLNNAWSILTVFWQITLGQLDFRGNIGPFYIILLPLLLFRRPMPPALKWILGYSFFYWVFWLFTGQHLRYYLGALPGLALVAAEAAAGWLAMLYNVRRRVLAVAAAAVLAVLAVLNTPFFEKYGTHSRYGHPITSKLPWRLLFLQETRDDYLTREVQDYAVIQHLNALPGPKRVLFWWNDPQPAAVHLRAEAAFIFSSYFHELLSEDAVRIHAVLRKHGVTHLIIGQMQQEGYLLSDPQRTFVQQYLKRIYQRNTVVLYEVLPGPVSQEVIAFDFLAHVQHARITTDPARTPGEPYRTTQPIGGERRYALVVFAPAEVEYSVTLPDRALLRFAIGRLFPPCDSRGLFKVWIQPVGPPSGSGGEARDGERQMIYQRELNAGNAMDAVGWFEEEIELAQFANSSARITFENEYFGPGTCNWFLWADPVIITPPRSEPEA